MYEVAYVILALVRITMGILICFAGYRLFRFSLPVIAFFNSGYFLGMAASVLAYG